VVRRWLDAWSRTLSAWDDQYRSAIVSAECTAEIDLRVPSQQLAEEMTHWFLGFPR
jgi:anti-sigma-K factor RskA